MNEDWLWDRSGPPDEEIERLERTFAPLRYRHRPVGPVASPVPRRYWAVAAAVVAAAVALTVGSRPHAAETGWRVAGAQVRQGEVLRTGNGALTLEAEAVGRVDVAPESVVRATSGKTLQLEHGQLHAFIWAPPREFVVDTPSARAVDLGCEYTLHVDPSGDGIVKVSMGWVAFAVHGRESFIPAGAQCRTRKRGGPGIPYYEDTPEAVRAGVDAFDSGDRSALGSILAGARERDGVTLWHLLTRVPEADRGVVFDRLAELVPMLPGLTREGVLRGDPQMIDRCWDALGLENTGWWRGWERTWR
jgi:hypothetical protein